LSSGLAETVLRRDRLIVLLGIAVIAALSWAYVVSLASDMQNNMGAATSDMPDMRGMDMATEMAAPQPQAWGTADFALILVMWAVMMVAMMTPSAAPMILMFAGISRSRREQQVPYVPTSVFLLGYLAVWGTFGILAAAAQWGLHASSLLSPTMASTGPVVGGVLLWAAGIYQWTPLKRACLRKCRSPLSFILNEWREGPRGAFLMGLKHGGYCLGCCWFLMALLFVAGVMNLLWVAAIAVYILVEKVVPAGHRVGQAAGVLLAVWGTLLIAGVLG
jgi:predicted metal-binding membrane protein